MNRKAIFTLSLLIIFFVGLSSVSASGNDTVLAGGEEITVSPGSSIQSAIDSAAAGSTIIVESGDYSENLVISKEISIKGQDANLNSDNIAFNILPTANKTSISGFNIVLSTSEGTGFWVNASDCEITDNRITGGKIGIFSNSTLSNDTGELDSDMISNLHVLRNSISNTRESGISVISFNPIVSDNNVSDVTNNEVNGTASGIQVNGAVLNSQNLNVIVTDNRVTNIKSLKGSAYGFNIGGNSVFGDLVEFDVAGNVAENILGAAESYGMNIGVFALNSTLPNIKVKDLNITGVSGGDYENATVTGLAFSMTTIGQNETSDGIVENVKISNVGASGTGSSATGIKATTVGRANLIVRDNDVTGIEAASSAAGLAATGVDYSKFQALVRISGNNFTSIKSPKSKGIYYVSLGNIEITKNLLYDIPGEDSIYMTGVALSIEVEGMNFTIPENATIDEVIELLKKYMSELENANLTNNAYSSITGNNLEGTGVETAFIVIMPSEIHYNRAVNFKYNVLKESARKYTLEAYDLDPNMTSEEIAYQYLKSQKDFENCTEEELRNMSAEMGKFIDRFYVLVDNLSKGDTDARFNWWGSNTRPSSSKFEGYNGEVFYDPWLILRVDSAPSVIDYGEYSKITANVYMDSSGFDHSADADQFFSGPRITFSTDIGSFDGKKSVTVDWFNGMATAYLYGDEYGLATVTASDYGSASTTVLIRGESPEKSSVSVMPSAGNPIFLVALVVILLSSIGVYKRS